MSTTDKYRMIRMTDQQQQITAAIQKVAGKPKRLVKSFFLC